MSLRLGEPPNKKAARWSEETHSAWLPFLYRTDHIHLYGRLGVIMYLLYLDASGTPDSANEQYYVLGGVAVFERRIYWLTQRLNEIESAYYPDTTESLEFHASVIRARREDPWASMARTDREQLMDEVPL